MFWISLLLKRKNMPQTTGLHNFKVAASLQGIYPEQALAGMMAKHTVSIYDMCHSVKAYPLVLWE